MARLTATFIFWLAMVTLLMPNVLFVTGEASPTVTVNGSCPFSPKFEVLDYNIDLIPQDTFYGSDIVQNIGADIVLRVKMVGNLTWINFTNYDAGHDTTLYFDFWCDTGSSNMPRMMQPGPENTISNITFSNGKTATDLVWKYRILVPPNASACSAVVNNFVGRNITWKEEINNNIEYSKNHNGDLKCASVNCNCNVKGLTNNLSGKYVVKTVWSRQDFFSKTQIEINEQMKRLTELATFIAAIALVLPILLRYLDVNDEIKRKRFETIYAPLLLILHRVDKSKDGIMGKKDIDKINVIIKENHSTLPSELINKWYNMFSDKTKRKVKKAVLREVIELVDKQHAKIANKWLAYYGEK